MEGAWMKTTTGKTADPRVRKTASEPPSPQRPDRESHDILEAMIRSAVDSIFCKDLDRRYTLANPAMEKLLGLPAKDIIGKRAEDLFSSEALAAIREVDSAALAGEVVSGLRTIPIGRDTFTFHVVQAPLLDENGSIRGICGIVRDVSEERKTETALRESEEKFRALAENADDVIMRFDRELRHLYVNPAVEAQTDIPPEQFIGKTHEELGFPEELCALFESALETTFQTKASERVEFQLPNGIWIDWLLTPELAADGEVVAVMTTARDFTAHKATEEKLVEALERAREVEKLKSSFLAHMSHEVRTPINHIVGLSTLLRMQRQELTDSEADEYLGIIRDSANALLEIITTVLDLSIAKTGRNQIVNEPVDLRAFLTEVFKGGLSRAEEKDLSYQMRIAPLAPDVVIVDRDKLDRILRSLLDNAIKFTSRGFVELHVWVEGATSENSVMCFRVEDSGIGIPEGVHEQIYSPFFQADMTPTREYVGAGLGLTIAREYAELVGGSLTLQSSAGAGATFTLSYPLNVAD
jgi:PAS domain S-box-containing protein